MNLMIILGMFTTIMAPIAPDREPREPREPRPSIERVCASFTGCGPERPDRCEEYGICKTIKVRPCEMTDSCVPRHCWVEDSDRCNPQPKQPVVCDDDERRCRAKPACEEDCKPVKISPCEDNERCWEKRMKDPDARREMRLAQKGIYEG